MSNKRGYAFIEVLAAIAVLTAFVVFAVETSTADARQQRELRRRAVAIEAVANGLEQITAQPFDSISPEAVGSLPVDEVRRTLPQAEFHLTVLPLSEPLSGKRLNLQLTWKSDVNQPQKTQITTWVYSPSAIEP